MNPGELSEQLVAQAEEYSRISSKLADVLRVKPGVWALLRDSVNSDTAAERAWQRTEEGIQEMECQVRRKALEKTMSALRTRIKVLSDEAHNLY